MAVTLEIIEGINQLGQLRFEVVEKDDWKFTSHGFFKTKQAAENYIVDFNMRWDEGEVEEERRMEGKR